MDIVIAVLRCDTVALATVEEYMSRVDARPVVIKTCLDDCSPPRRTLVLSTSFRPWPAAAAARHHLELVFDPERGLEEQLECLVGRLASEVEKIHHSLAKARLSLREREEIRAARAALLAHWGENY